MTDYLIDITDPIERIAEHLEKFAPDSAIELINDNMDVTLVKHLPFSYVTGELTGLVSLEITNKAGTSLPESVSMIKAVAELLAGDNPVEGIDFINHQGQRVVWMYFHPKVDVEGD